MLGIDQHYLAIQGFTVRSWIVVSAFILVVAVANSINAQEQINYSVLGIEFVGPLSDHYIEPIVISDSKEGTQWYRNELKTKDLGLVYTHVVSRSLVKRLISDVETHDGATLWRNDDSLQNPYKYIAVTVIVSERRQTFLYDEQSTISLLELLQRHTANKHPLKSHLLELERWVRQYTVPEQPG